MATLLLPRSRRSIAWDADAVAAFDRESEDLLILERPVMPEIAQAISSVRVYDFRSHVTSETAIDQTDAALRALNLDCPALAADIVAIVRSFLAQFEISEVSFRLEAVDRASCPKFHCDNVRMRLVTTYHGPSTEYVCAEAPEQVRRAATFALVFLKGHKHPLHVDTVHHRSPAVPSGKKRVCLVLDY